jgi:hypothetical protein
VAAGSAVLRNAHALLCDRSEHREVGGLISLIAASVSEAKLDIVADQHLE